MADVLDIHNIEKFEVDDVGDVNVKTLKTRVTHRRGRGFKKDEKSEPRTPLSNRSVAFVGDNSQPQRSVEGWIVFVTGIHEEAQEEDLHDVFAEYGKIKNLNLNLDRRTGYTKGYALIEYSLFKEAAETIAKLNQTKILDEVISVDWTFVKETNRNLRSSGASSSRKPSITPSIPGKQESKWERRESRDHRNNTFKLEYD